MSKPLTLTRLVIDQPATGALPAKYTMYLSNQKTHEVLGSFQDTPEQMAVAVANRLLELNTITYEHAILAGHVQVLAKFKRAIIRKGINSIHREKDLNGTDLELTKAESANLTFLRYHALLVRDRDAGSGFWLLTTRGNEFLRGERTISKYAVVRDNEVIDHSGPQVAVTDIWKQAPYWPRKDELIMERHYTEPVQQGFAL